MQQVLEQHFLRGFIDPIEIFTQRSGTVQFQLFAKLPAECLHLVESAVVFFSVHQRDLPGTISGIEPMVSIVVGSDARSRRELTRMRPGVGPSSVAIDKNENAGVDSSSVPMTIPNPCFVGRCQA